MPLKIVTQNAVSVLWAALSLVAKNNVCFVKKFK
jgi:hypothetical protein